MFPGFGSPILKKPLKGGYFGQTVVHPAEPEMQDASFTSAGFKISTTERSQVSSGNTLSAQVQELPTQ